MEQLTQTNESIKQKRYRKRKSKEHLNEVKETTAISHSSIGNINEDIKKKRMKKDSSSKKSDIDTNKEEMKISTRKIKRGGRRNNKNKKHVEEVPTTSPSITQITIPQKIKEIPKEISINSSIKHLSDTLFADLEISVNSKRAILQDLQYERLTIVQNATYQYIADGNDILAKAKTGHGKTMAFLLPVIENLVKRHRNVSSIPVVIISPTRELSQQIANEALKLAKYHDIRILCVVGGTKITKDEKELNKTKPLDILIATPGRLIDHLHENRGNIVEKISNCSCLILDEADRLLDMGFRLDLLSIIGYLPRDRQTLLFSATLPETTTELKEAALREDYVFVDTIDKDEEQTNSQTHQEYIICSLENVIPMVEHVIKKHIESCKPSYKVILFFPTARTAQFMAQLFQAAGFQNVLEIHSRKSQSARTKTSDQFRTGKQLLLFSSDVSARGVDYPDVSLVVQVGMTDRDQYIHRLGRTARAGMGGSGVLILADFESACVLNTLKDLPLQEAISLSLPSRTRTSIVIEQLFRNKEVESSAKQSYQAWLGFYNSKLKLLKLSREQIVKLAEEYSHTIGLEDVPLLEKRTLVKMNLFGVKGITPSPYNRNQQSSRSSQKQRHW